LCFSKGFVRAYGFLGAILPYGNAEWEKLSIFLNFLLPKLPSPQEEDLTQGILDAIDLDSYRLEAQAMLSIQLQDENAAVDPVPTGGGGGKPEPEMDQLTNILMTFNDLFGNIEWTDADNVRRQIREIPAMVSRDEKYRNAMKNSDKQNARMESDRVPNSIKSGKLKLLLKR
jgi:type I restriction enzyme R subunit